MTNSIGMESGILAISLPGRGIIGKELYKILMEHTAQTPLLLLLKTGITMAFRRDNIETNSFDASYVKLSKFKLQIV
jgi:hypothetical protein